MRWKKWGLSWFARNSFLNLDTFKSSDLIGCKDSYWELSKCFKMITWLQWFLCQLSHWWWVESNWSVISCGFPMMSVMMSIILPARRMCRVNYFKIFIITLFVYIAKKGCHIRIEIIKEEETVVKVACFEGQLWPWSYGSWIYNYLSNQCLSPLMLWFRISIRARCTTLCDIL